MPSLRKAMQSILDDLQSDEQDELNKVSLERLAAIDPDLLIKIKHTAEDSVRSGTSDHDGGGGSRSSIPNQTKATRDVLSFLIETRSPETMRRSQMWENSSQNFMKDSHDIIASLNHLVRESASMTKRYTQTEAMEMTGDLAAASVIATLLTNSLQQLKDLEDQSKNKKKFKTTLTGSQRATGTSQTPARSFFVIDKTLFTTEGVKKLDEAVVGLLYDIGLPFISSVDGRRFATQMELSQHLDSLFKKGQLEKTMRTTQERGWYDDTVTWCGKGKEIETIASGLDGDDNSDGPTGDESNFDPDTFTTPADESRDRCVICGINFKMIFDNDDGIYKYSGAREIEVLNDEAAATESEQMLVHVTCWRNLGSPQILTADQTIQSF
jgi:pre-mRNA cleavage complex 2 protein Pcf11